MLNKILQEKLAQYPDNHNVILWSENKFVEPGISTMIEEGERIKLTNTLVLSEELTERELSELLEECKIKCQTKF